MYFKLSDAPSARNDETILSECWTDTTESSSAWNNQIFNDRSSVKEKVIGRDVGSERFTYPQIGIIVDQRVGDCCAKFHTPCPPIDWPERVILVESRLRDSMRLSRRVRTLEVC